MNITSTSGEVLLKDMTEGKSLFIETKSGILAYGIKVSRIIEAYGQK